MDALSHILELIKLKGVVYTKLSFSAPWGVAVSPGPFAQFRMIVSGQCVLKVEGQKLIKLKAGDMVFFPHGAAHWIADSETSPRFNGSVLLAAIRSGQAIFVSEGDTTTTISGHFEFDRSSDHPFIKALPEFILISDTDRRELAWLEHTGDILMEELRSDKMGSNLMVSRLSEVLFIHTIRAFLEKNKTQKGFLKALQDPSISAALGTIHNNPGKEWTLESLSKIAGISRTLFINRFKEMVGETPMKYLSSWRVLKAKEMLAGKPDTVHEITINVGYQSEAAFNRVFKKQVKQTPAAYRRMLKVVS